ncbi:hypothetical protein BDZ45DRAFT_292880 [Acephala macrosclerotiorum]|nr:hypothetical protein BDZ45DRAFT_292880 [Acephala macrosclerotiorum]
MRLLITTSLILAFLLVVATQGSHLSSTQIDVSAQQEAQAVQDKAPLIPRLGSQDQLQKRNIPRPVIITLICVSAAVVFLLAAVIGARWGVERT